MPLLLFGGSSYLNKIQSVHPDRLVELWPQNEPLGAGVSNGIVRGYDGTFTNITLGQTGVPGTGMTSAGYNGATSFNDIYGAGLANDNLLLNPGFETAGGAPPTWANWADTVGDGIIANEVVIVHEGVDAAKLTSGLTSNTKTAQTVVVVPGERRRERIWAYGDGVNAGRYGVYDVTNTADIIAITSTGVTAAAWTMVAVEFTVPAGCISMRIDLWCPPVPGGVCYYDACEVRRVNGFLGDEGSLLAWARVSAGVWTDGTARRIASLLVDGNNWIGLYKTGADNLAYNYEAATVVEQEQIAVTPAGFFSVAMTWSASADEVVYYYNGGDDGGNLTVDTVLGTWLGDLVANSAVIGASTTAPGDVWDGDIGPVALWSTALSPDAMRYLGTL